MPAWSPEARLKASLARKIKNRLGQAAYEEFKRTGRVPPGLDLPGPPPKESLGVPATSSSKGDQSDDLSHIPATVRNLIGGAKLPSAAKNALADASFPNGVSNILLALVLHTKGEDRDRVLAALGKIREGEIPKKAIEKPKPKSKPPTTKPDKPKAAEKAPPPLLKRDDLAVLVPETVREAEILSPEEFDALRIQLREKLTDETVVKRLQENSFTHGYGGDFSIGPLLNDPARPEQRRYQVAYREHFGFAVTDRRAEKDSAVILNGHSYTAFKADKDKRPFAVHAESVEEILTLFDELEPAAATPPDVDLHGAPPNKRVTNSFLRLLKNPIKADLGDSTSLDGDVSSLRTFTGGVNVVRRGKINGKDVIVKFALGLNTTEQMRGNIPMGTDLKRESATYALANILKDIAPESTPNMPAYSLRAIDGKGMAGVSELVGSAKTLAESQGEIGARELKDVIPLDMIEDAAFFDTLVGNLDRHMGNVMISTKGRFVMIDHGLTFPTSNAGNIGNAIFHTMLDPRTKAPPLVARHKKILEALLDRKDEVEKSFVYLEPEAREAFWDRVDEMRSSGVMKLLAE